MLVVIIVSCRQIPLYVQNPWLTRQDLEEKVNNHDGGNIYLALIRCDLRCRLRGAIIRPKNDWIKITHHSVITIKIKEHIDR